MNKQEYLNWLESTNFVSSDTEYDSSGNKRETQIRTIGGKFFKLDIFNGEHSPVFGPKGWEKDNYQIQEVKEIKKVIEIIEYEPVK